MHFFGVISLPSKQGKTGQAGIYQGNIVTIEGPSQLAGSIPTQPREYQGAGNAGRSRRGPSRTSAENSLPASKRGRGFFCSEDLQWKAALREGGDQQGGGGGGGGLKAHSEGRRRTRSGMSLFWEGRIFGGEGGPYLGREGWSTQNKRRREREL
jgi:hypothetical protein